MIFRLSLSHLKEVIRQCRVNSSAQERNPNNRFSMSRMRYSNLWDQPSTSEPPSPSPSDDPYDYASSPGYVDEGDYSTEGGEGFATGYYNNPPCNRFRSSFHCSHTPDGSGFQSGGWPLYDHYPPPREPPREPLVYTPEPSPPVTSAPSCCALLDTGDYDPSCSGSVAPCADSNGISTAATPTPHITMSPARGGTASAPAPQGQTTTPGRGTALLVA